MSTLTDLLTVRQTGVDSWHGSGAGPEGKRSFGGLFAAQSLAAAIATVPAEKRVTNMHLQFLRGGEAGDGADYRVERVYDGRTAAARRVEGRQHDRLLNTATVSFSAEMAGPEHGTHPMPTHPDALDPDRSLGPSPSVPLDEFEIRVDDQGDGPDFVRRFWWRATVALPADPVLHTLVAVYITDLYGVDPIFAVHGHSMRDRTYRGGTTDTSMWFHRPVFADQWNLLESRSPAAARGRGVVSASLVRADGAIAATMVQEGLAANR
ncbi:acyl-CoA thioesterase domain-containing protein [Arthrobacter sp. SLBN-53]|uniref:acyl-CoA thioesterase n=1 Tax=Arthrobacter sp. SLBN-53 TaxID=2768412 RepID=UPI001153FF7D|nr:acyl-CoA thioesterase domain-containing protein [Arthrobacter sp. SLBN-53]TQK31550.1 acyl-CoA thioesterase II [Arthrobacter sp. SLBN-53]